MRKALAVTARLTAGLLAVLFVAVTVMVLALFNVGLHLFSPGVYQRALAEGQLYTRAPALIAEQLVTQMNYAGPGTENAEATQDEAPPGEQDGPPPAFQNLTRADWETILSIVLPPDWLQTQTENALNQVFANLDSPDPTATVSLSLVELKARLSSQAGVNAFLQIVRAQPPCTSDGLRQWTAGELTDLPTCRPPDEIIAAATPQIQALVSGAVANLPDEADVTRLFASGDEREPGETRPSDAAEPAQDPRAALRLIRLGLWLSPLIPIVLLLLIALFGVRSLKGLLRWWGIPLLLAGLSGAVLAGVLLPAMKLGYTTYIAAKVPPYFAAGFVQAGLEVAWYIARVLAGWIGGTAGLIGLMGLGLFVGSFYLKEQGTVGAERVSPLPGAE
jgi:hypothetical protein